MAKGTVLVNLGNDWFSPDGVLYREMDNPHEFPAAWAEPGEKKEAPVKETVTTSTTGGEDLTTRYAVLPSTAEIVESQDTVAVLQNTANGEQVMMPSAVQDGAKSVGGAVGEHGLEEPHQSVAEAAKVAKDAGVDQVGGKPDESGPLPAGTKKKV
jgi:hypothetical protein